MSRRSEPVLVAAAKRMDLRNPKETPMRTFLIAATLVAAITAPAFATTTDNIPASEEQAIQMPNLPHDAQASDTGLKNAPEAAPIVEALRKLRRE
jgi:hypothetical protein